MLNNCPCIHLAVSGNKLSLVENVDATTNIVNAIKCEFDFRSSEWANLTKTVIFSRSGVPTKSIILTSYQNSCYIPWEILENTTDLTTDIHYEIGIYGIGVDAERLPTNRLKLTLKQGSYISSEAPQEPTPSLYEQIMAAINDIDTVSITDITTEIENYCINADYATREYVDDAISSAQSGIITETDPTVPSWAKQPNKPSYTAEEVGALPSSTVIPSAYNDTALRELIIAETNARITADEDKASLVHTHDNYIDDSALQSYVTEAIDNIDTVSSNDLVDYVSASLSTITPSSIGAVAVVDGKDLSTNDYTNTDKAKVDVITTDGSSSKYLNESGAYTEITPMSVPEVFMATYGTTTSEQIETAYQSGKIITCNYNGVIYYLTRRDSATFHLFNVVNGSDGFVISCDSNVWNYISYLLLSQSGGQFTGAVSLNYIPTANNHAVSKGYVDTAIQGVSSDEPYVLIESITLTEDTRVLERNTEPNGTVYNFKDVYISADLKASTGDAVLSCNFLSSLNGACYASLSANAISNTRRLGAFVTEMSHGRRISHTKDTWVVDSVRNQGNMVFIERMDSENIGAISLSTTSSTKLMSAGSIIKIYAVRA